MDQSGPGRADARQHGDDLISQPAGPCGDARRKGILRTRVTAIVAFTLSGASALALDSVTFPGLHGWKGAATVVFWLTGVTTGVSLLLGILTFAEEPQ